MEMSLTLNIKLCHKIGNCRFPFIVVVLFPKPASAHWLKICNRKRTISTVIIMEWITPAVYTNNGNIVVGFLHFAVFVYRHWWTHWIWCCCQVWRSRIFTEKPLLELLTRFMRTSWSLHCNVCLCVSRKYVFVICIGSLFLIIWGHLYIILTHYRKSRLFSSIPGVVCLCCCIVHDFTVSCLFVPFFVVLSYTIVRLCL